MFFSEVDNTFAEEIRKVLPVSMALERERLWPFIEAAERKYIYPILGKDLYEETQKVITDAGSGSLGSGDEDAAKVKELIRLIQIAELNLAYYVGFDVIGVKISDAGFQRVESEKIKGLYKYQEINLRTYFAETGFNGIDDILQYLEGNIEHFPEWEECPANIMRQKMVIKDADSFNLICDINRSRLTFLRLIPFMSQVVDMEIIAAVGQTVWDNLMAAITSESPEAKYVALMPHVQKPLAFLSAALLVLNTGDLTFRGLYFESRNSLYPDPSTSRPAEGDSLALRYKYYRDSGIQYLESLKQYLIRNAFAEYSGQSGSIYNRDNDGKKTFVA